MISVYLSLTSSMHSAPLAVLVIDGCVQAWCHHMCYNTHADAMCWDG